MSDAWVVWAVAAAIGVHNLEEALRLPGWSRTAPARWRSRTRAGPFRFAVFVLTVLVFALAAWTRLGGRGCLGHLLLATFALGQGVNVVFPHLVAALATRSMAPGLASGVLLVWPSSCAVLRWTLAAGDVSIADLGIAAAVFVPLVLASIPLLFRIGGRLERIAGAGGMRSGRSVERNRGNGDPVG